MEQFKEDQLVICGRVVDYLAENEAALAPSAIATAQATDVAALYGRVTRAQGGTAKRTAKLSEAAKAAHTQLLDLLPALLGLLSRVATWLKDDDLLALVTLQRKRLRPLAFC